MMIHYKRKPFVYKNEQCETLLRIDADGHKVMKAKKKFDTDKEAIAEAKRMNGLPTQIHKVVAYKCGKCGKWHVGRTNKVLEK